MKSFLFRLYLAWKKFCVYFIKIDPKQVTILNGAGRSGSNGYLFYKYLKQQHPDYRVSLVEPWPSSHLKWQDWQQIGRAKFILTTHQPFKVKRGQINIQLWHGVPLKRMGYMAHNTRRRDNQRNARLWQKKADVVASTSDLYESLMTSCMNINADKYQRLGYPRLDFLKKPAISKKQFLKELFGQEDPQAQLGIYLPTFRYELKEERIMQQIAQGNFFAFADFSGQELNEFLQKRHLYLLVKLHPYEMRLFQKEKSQWSNIAFLNNDYLFNCDIDLYEILPATDFLATDFSSIYFDYLHLNKPIIFLTNFLKQYQEVRGLLMGPYQEIVPGVQVKNQQELLAALTDLARDPAAAKRQYWLKLTDQVAGPSCPRIFSYIKNH